MGQLWSTLSKPRQGHRAHQEITPIRLLQLLQRANVGRNVLPARQSSATEALAF